MRFGWQIRFQQLEEALQCALVLIQHFNGVAAIEIAIIGIGE
jgi:hypothetical protein